MFFIMLLRWIRGYYCIRVSLGASGKLMTLCAHNGILFWKGEQREDAYYGCVARTMYSRLCALASRAGIDVQECGRHGLPYLANRYRKRIGLLCGGILFLVLLAVSQQFIWSVKIEGNVNTNPAELTALLAEQGVRWGALKRNIDQRYIAREMLIHGEGLSWAALNLHGTTAILRIRERTPPPPKIDTNVPANLVASEDGQIKRLQVTDGKAVLQEGDTVRKGEVIVSGVWQDQWGLTHFIRAGGQAYAHVPRKLTVKIPLLQETCSFTDVKRHTYLEISSLQIPLFFYQEPQGEYKTERYSEYPVFLGITMPFSIGHENMLFFERQQQKISPEQALARAQRQLEVLERHTFGDDPIISRDVSAEFMDGALTLQGNYEIEMDIAERRDIGMFEYDTPEDKKKIPREAGY